MTHPDAIMRGHFGVGLLDPGCSSSACCHFKPSLCSEGLDKLERPPPVDSGGTTEGSDGFGRPIFASFGATIDGLDGAGWSDSTGFEATIKGPDKARWPDSADSEAVVEGPNGARRFDSAGSGGASSPSCPMACHRKGPAYGKGGSSSMVARSSHGMGDPKPSSSSSDEP